MATFKLFNNHIRKSFALLALAEALIFYVSVFVAVSLRFTTTDFSQIAESVDHISLKATVFMVLHMLFMVALGLYQVDQFKGRTSLPQMTARIIVSMLLVTLGLMVVYYLVPVTELGRGVTALALITSFSGMLILRRLFFSMVDGNLFISKILVLGVGHKALSILKLAESQTNPSFKIKGFVATPEQGREVPEGQIIELGDSLLQSARKLQINEIVVALDDRRKGYPVQHLLDCKLAGIKILEPVSFLEREQGKVNLAHLNPSWMIFGDGFAVSMAKEMLSRVFDIVASLGILILMSPILLVTAFLIGLEGWFREPILYRQERVGKNGHRFELLKFRSMRIDAEKNGAQWAAKHDARVTRVGRFIRKVRIDELPQILNILKGDMRLVGPRPERPEFVNKLSESIALYQERHSVKPGLAGWAQLKYPYGATEEDAYEKLQYDLYYIKNANPVMDFFILLQTLEVVLFGKGAR